MAIVFKARVLLELGAELISSDAVALYELVKNAIDAGSPDVEIAITVVLQRSSFDELNDILDGNRTDKDKLVIFKEAIDRLIEDDAPQEALDIFHETLGVPRSVEDAKIKLAQAYFKANKIVISDRGHGMTMGALRSCYLTVGTPMRVNEREARKQKKSDGAAPILGEKGIGRLSAMRLGHYVYLKTAVKSESNWHVLRMDWRKIFADPNLDADALDYEPQVGKEKPEAEYSGTKIIIRDLQSDWSLEKINGLISSEMAKLANPFDSNFFNKYFKFYYQDQKLQLAFFEKLKLNHADAVCTASFKKLEGVVSKNPLDSWELSVLVEYKRYGTQRLHTFSGEHLAGCVRENLKRIKANSPVASNDVVVSALKTLGPFETKFWWFNRGRIRKENNELWSGGLEAFVRSWSGGLLVYRDGFRVYPYGGPADDWLDLDRNALSASQYKLNRSQIVGYLKIGKEENPELHDQTNREGFRDTPEKEALRRLLRHVFITECRRYLETVDKQNKIADVDTVDELEERLTDSQKIALKGLSDLQTRVPQESETIEKIRFQLADIQDAWERAKITIKSHDEDMEQYVHLAGVGLQVEFISHELARVTGDALDVLSKKGDINNEVTKKFLHAQLKTLNKRVRVLDMLSIPGRQTKTWVDLEDVSDLLYEVHENKIRRHGIVFEVNVINDMPLKVKAEKGQVLQILDNLFSNSFYWLKHRFNRDEPPNISIQIDYESRSLIFSDNGPGIPESISDNRFDPFVTSKTSGEGRGLGLFISRRLASYNDAELVLGEKINGKYNSFVLKFKQGNA
ncbi:ATP-binding protein [Pseudomonas aeruginosa]|uniref:sensor histidine kinase n=1 Tax=Pseudomonas TaxID=286 RepID=UPI0009A2FB12|nr:HAMP domain-containing sensor histidine kinase [Pseudomonas aeruginosa]HBP6261869.1 sensor histidine kinase [Pseudomonas aeruginosa]HEJ1148129.1 sensor histidine kinase [Pseudomonas aeruginosa]